MVDILIGIVGINYIYYSLLYFALPSIFRFTYLIFGSSYYYKLFLEIEVPKTKQNPLKVARL